MADYQDTLTKDYTWVRISVSPSTHNFLTPCKAKIKLHTEDFFETHIDL